MSARKPISPQAAFDSGYGRRSISYDRTNPYSETSEPELFAAWDRGWDSADRELNAAAIQAPVNPFSGVNADAMSIIGTLLGKVWQQGDEWEHPVCDQWLCSWRATRGENAFGPWRWWIGEIDGESYALDFATREEAVAAAPDAIRKGDLRSDDGRYWIVEACVWNDDVTAADDILWFGRQRNRATLTVEATDG